MEQSDTFYSIILAGQNGLGGESFRANNIINTPSYTQYTTPTSFFQIDFGQDNCIRHFEEQLAHDPNLKDKKLKLLLNGISQGTATLINWLAQQPQEEQENQVAALVLESVLGSGNSAVIHTIKSMFPQTCKTSSCSILFTYFS